MSIVESALDKVREIANERCGKCPAFWSNVDYWGEYDAGCLLHRDIDEFCKLSLFPKPIVKVMVEREEKRQGEYYDKMSDQMEQEEIEADHLQKALLTTLNGNGLDICFQGEKVEIDFSFTYEFLREFKKLRGSAIDTTESPSVAGAVPGSRR